MADAPCLHPDFRCEVDVNRLFDGTEAGRDLPADRYAIDVRVRCSECGAAFEFVGLPAGIAPDHPTVGVSRTELHAPIVPSGEAIRPGGLGFSVSAHHDFPEPPLRYEVPPDHRRRRPD